MDGATMETGPASLVDETGVETEVVDVTGWGHVQQASAKGGEAADQPYARQSSVVSADRQMKDTNYATDVGCCRKTDRLTAFSCNLIEKNVTFYCNDA